MKQIIFFTLFCKTKFYVLHKTMWEANDGKEVANWERQESFRKSLNEKLVNSLLFIGSERTWFRKLIQCSFHHSTSKLFSYSCSNADNFELFSFIECYSVQYVCRYFIVFLKLNEHTSLKGLWKMKLFWLRYLYPRIIVKCANTQETVYMEKILTKAKFNDSSVCWVYWFVENSFKCDKITSNKVPTQKAISRTAKKLLNQFKFSSEYFRCSPFASQFSTEVVKHLMVWSIKQNFKPRFRDKS